MESADQICVLDKVESIPILDLITLVLCSRFYAHMCPIGSSLSKGAVVEEGTFQELMRRGGFFGELMKQRSGQI